jgi:lysophospholipase L1-like esterase
MKLKKKEMVFIFIMALGTICFLEGIFLVLCMLSPKIDNMLTLNGTFYPPTIPDEHLGIRSNPRFPEHDSNGFRNKSVPKVVDVVVLGDSQTYGTGVEIQEAWPKQIEFMTKSIVYSMAYGSYGPVHYLILINEAIALRPKIVIEAFYAGNDLFDSFNLVYNNSQHPELKTDDSLILKSIQMKEEKEPIANLIAQRYNMEDKVDDEYIDLKKGLLKYSRLFGLFRNIKHSIIENIYNPWENAKRFAVTHAGYCQVFDDGRFKTIFTPEYRLSALDLKDPRIYEGLTISLKAIQQTNNITLKQNIQFIVLLIPTKELVFNNLVQHPLQRYLTLVRNEQQFWDTAKIFFHRNNIEYIDALPTLQEQLALGVNPYQITYDGHPNKFGHKAIANLVIQQIKNRQ